jgi:IS1 family transposase
MRVEGVSISASARIAGWSRNTIARWVGRAAAAAGQFNNNELRGFEIKELQADELCTFVGNKSNTTWVFAVIEVWSRLWPTTVIGRRSYRNTEAVFNDVLYRGTIVGRLLVTSDGFDYYEAVIRRLLGHACVYGQVLKTRRNNRVIRVARLLKIGTESQLMEALLESEDSATLNTAFVERLNLTARQGSAYLHRRSPSHARRDELLVEHIELLKSHYNFIRPHLGLKFGPVCRTPAMQARLVTKALSFRDIFIRRYPPRANSLPSPGQAAMLRQHF